MDFRCLETRKTLRDVFLCRLLEVTLPCHAVGLEDLQLSLPTLRSLID